MTDTIAPDSSVRVYAAALGMSFAVVRAWANCEGQFAPVPTNVLNIQPGNTPGQTGAVGPIATYASVAEGARWTAWLINRGPYGGVRAARAAHASDHELARAIERSPWAGSNYGSTPSSDGCIARQISVAPPVRPTVTAPPTFRREGPGARVTVKAGQTIYFPDAKTPYSHTDGLTTFPWLGSSAGWLLIADGGVYAAVARGAVASLVLGGLAP